MSDINMLNLTYPYENDPQLMTLCFETNAFYRRYHARRHASFATPRTGDHVMVIRHTPEMEYIDSGLYRITTVAPQTVELHEFRPATCNVVAVLVNQDDTIFTDEALKKQYLTLTKGHTLSPTLEGTFDSKGYTWQEGYTDLRQYVIRHFTGPLLLKRDKLLSDMECVKIRHRFCRDYLDTTLGHPSSDFMRISAEGRLLFYTGVATGVVIGLSTSFIPLVIPAAGCMFMGAMAIVNKQNSASRYTVGFSRLLSRHTELRNDENETQHDMMYKAKILTEIVRGFVSDHRVAEWRVLKLNEAVCQFDTLTYIGLQLEFHTFVWSFHPLRGSEE